MGETEKGRKRLWKDGRGQGKPHKFRRDWIKAREAGESERRLECRRRRPEMSGCTPGYLIGDELFRDLAHAKKTKIDGGDRRKFEEAGE